MFKYSISGKNGNFFHARANQRAGKTTEIFQSEPGESRFVTLSQCNRKLSKSTNSGKVGRGKGKTGKKAVSRSAKAGLQFPVGRVARYMRNMASTPPASAPVPPCTSPPSSSTSPPRSSSSPATPPATTRRPASCPATSSWPSATMRSSPSFLAPSPSPPVVSSPTSTPSFSPRSPARTKCLSFLNFKTTKTRRALAGFASMVINNHHHSKERTHVKHQTNFTRLESSPRRASPRKVKRW